MTFTPRREALATARAVPLLLPYDRDLAGPVRPDVGPEVLDLARRATHAAPTAGDTSCVMSVRSPHSVGSGAVGSELEGCVVGVGDPDAEPAADAVEGAPQVFGVGGGGVVQPHPAGLHRRHA